MMMHSKHSRPMLLVGTGTAPLREVKVLAGRGEAGELRAGRQGAKWKWIEVMRIPADVERNYPSKNIEALGDTAGLMLRV
jgi:hypothetical protein